MSVTNRFPLWGKLGESPIDGFEYDGGDQVNEKHLNYLWDKIQKQTDDFITKTDDLQTQLDGHEAATEAHGSDGDVVGQNTLDSHTTATEAHGSDGVVVGQNTLDSVQTTLEGDIADVETKFDDHSARHSSGGPDEVTVENLGTSGAADTVPVSQGDGTLVMGDAGVSPEDTFWYASIF